MSTLNLEHLPPDKPVQVFLFKDVQNAGFLKQQLLAGNADYEYALIDASVILSTTHALQATYRAVSKSLGGGLKSKNVHSEIVFSLSPNNNIAESFRRFGVEEKTTSLLAIKVSTGDQKVQEDVRKHITSVVEGTLVSFDDEAIRSLHDVDKIRKVYKLIAGKKIEQGIGGSEIPTLEAAVLGQMALQGAG